MIEHDLNRLIIQNLAEPQERSTLIKNIINQEDLPLHTIPEVELKLWEMTANKEVHLRLDWRLENGPEYPRQLPLPGMADEAEEAHRARTFKYWRPEVTSVFEANQELAS